MLQERSEAQILLLSELDTRPISVYPPCALVFSLFSNFPTARSHKKHIINLWSAGSLGLLHGTVVKSHVLEALGVTVGKTAVFPDSLAWL